MMVKKESGMYKRKTAEMILERHPALQPRMRAILIEWMMEVCEDKQFNEEVFFLAINYLDRFLSKVKVKKSRFQLVASVCIFIASKFSDRHSLTLQQLVNYTDNSISVNEIKEWEFQLLKGLNWKVAAVTAFNFLDHFCNKDKLTNYDQNVWREAVKIASFALKEYRFITTKQSLLAAASYSLAYYKIYKSFSATNILISKLSKLIRANECDVEYIFHSILFV